MPLPQPLVVTVQPPAAVPAASGPPPADWNGAVKQLRDVSQWIIGGVIATAAGVFAGSTLTNLGHLDPAGSRLQLAIGGVVLGFVALTAILVRGIDVIAPAGGNLHLLADAERGPLLQARKWVFRMNNIGHLETHLKEWLAHQTTVDARRYLPKIFPCAAFAIVRARFNRMLWTMAVAMPLAIFGFGLFAWAANPPEPPQKGMVIKITN